MSWLGNDSIAIHVEPSRRAATDVAAQMS